MNITVLGCGALGQLWLSALHRQGHTPQAWLKIAQPHVEFQLISPEQQCDVYQLPANNLEKLKSCELLLVTLKATQIQAALTPLFAFLPAECAIVLMHNGLGVVDELPAVDFPLLHAITTQAASREGNTTRHNARGLTQLGPLNQAASQQSSLADLLHQALPDVAWYDDIRLSAWKKLAINAVINPLSVKYHCANGHLAEHLSEVEQLCQELALVMHRENIPSDPQQLIEQVINVIRTTAANHSSMLQDVRAQRRTEIEYINGYLLNRARRYGLTLTNHSALYHLVKQQESTYATSTLSTSLPSTW